MKSRADRNPRRLALLSSAALLGVLGWPFVPLPGNAMFSPGVESRPVTARGDLGAEEAATIELFERASPSVVYISTKRRVVDYWSRDVMSVRE